jgi:hypothetical protein
MVLWPPMRNALEKQQAARQALVKTPMNLTLRQTGSCFEAQYHYRASLGFRERLLF